MYIKNERGVEPTARNFLPSIIIDSEVRDVAQLDRQIHFSLCACWFSILIILNNEKMYIKKERGVEPTFDV